MLQPTGSSKWATGNFFGQLEIFFKEAVLVKNMSTESCYNQLEAVSEQLEIFSINWKYFSMSFKAVLVKNMSTETCYEQLEAVSEQLEIFSTNRKYF